MNVFSEFAEFINKDRGIEVLWAGSGQKALDLVGTGSISAVVVDEILVDRTALSFVRQLTKHQPLINCAMVSSLPPDDFHEATEGLGIFIQLPVSPGVKEAELMLKMLETIEVLMTL